MNEKIKALAKYLGVKPSEVKSVDSYFDDYIDCQGCYYSTPNGNYVVCTEDEAFNLAVADFCILFDEIGDELFSGRNSKLRDYVYYGLNEQVMYSFLYNYFFDDYYENQDDEYIKSELEDYEILYDSEFDTEKEFDEYYQKNRWELISDLAKAKARESSDTDEDIDILEEIHGDSIEHLVNLGFIDISEVAEKAVSVYDKESDFMKNEIEGTEFYVTEY